MGDDCCNRTKQPFHIPGYQGVVPGLNYENGKTYAKTTHDLIMKNVVRPGAKGPRVTVYPDPCRGHEADLRARCHMLQGNIDPNPCEGTDWNSRNKFCIQKPLVDCPPKLSVNNKHGYLSRLSVYKSKNMDVHHCRACNTQPCPGREPLGKPFIKEYEDLTNYDLFQDFDKECRHLRIPKLKYKTNSCWEEDFYLPIECVSDYCKMGYIRPPKSCDCMPFEAKADDRDVNYYRIEPDARSFGMPLFKDPTNPYRWFKSGYAGHVPTERFRIGDVYPTSTKKALNRFTINYITPHLSDRCPVYVNPQQYCDPTDYFACFCDRRRSYDGHFHPEHIRTRLKNRFDPKCCVPPCENNPLPICIQPMIAPEPAQVYCNTKGTG
ncbi:unnamed protein product [Allacma fusca]|uniref:Ciliary microtubule inner protein 2A-C-like domain-containing protein n=1 Tax=Allacma fusca TaxID=39272 RepID=A0A8J2JNS4_9HEXA|nr:unnamed protein product [Allacma fusca]